MQENSVYACIKLLCRLNSSTRHLSGDLLDAHSSAGSSIVLANKNNDSSSDDAGKNSGDIVATSGLDNSATNARSAVTVQAVLIASAIPGQW